MLVYQRKTYSEDYEIIKHTGCEHSVDNSKNYLIYNKVICLQNVNNDNSSFYKSGSQENSQKFTNTINIHLFSS